jgi:hypothetical protein
MKKNEKSSYRFTTQSFAPGNNGLKPAAAGTCPALGA